MSTERLRLTRREFFNLSAATAASLAVPFLSSPEVHASCETDRRNNELLIVDFDPQQCLPWLAQDTQESNEDLIARLSINLFPEDKRNPLEFAYNVTNPVRRAGTLLREGILERIPLDDPITERLDRLQGHGKLVGGVIRDTLLTKGYDVTPVLQPIQELYDFARFDKDASGNPMFIAKLNTDRFIEVLGRYPESKIVNFSWQVGEVGFKTDILGKDEERDNSLIQIPGLSVLGAYRKEHALENLSELARVCRTYEDKLFVAAAGNFGDDLREAKRELMDKGLWRNNLIMVGEYFPGEWDIYSDNVRIPRMTALGADIYGNSLDRRFNKDNIHGSTVITAITTAGAACHLYSGITSPTAIKEALFTDCHPLRIDEPVTTREGVTYQKSEIRIYNPDNT